MDARVEVVARLGDTVIEHAHLPPESVYRIGTAPEVELPCALARCFTLVEVGATGATIHRPRGVPARVIDDVRTTELAGDDLPLAPGVRVVLELELVTVEIGLVALPRSVVPRRAFERRPYWFGLAVLVAHVTAWAISVWLAPYRERVVRKPRRPVHVRRIASEEVTTVKPIELSIVPAAEPAKGPKPAAIARAKTSTEAMRSLSTGWGSLTDIDALQTAMEDLGPVYDETTAGGFGTGGRFDPDKDPKFASIKVGRYATVADGRGAGAFYDLGQRVAPQVALCESSRCVVTGGSDDAAVRHELEARTDDLVACYRDHAPGAIEGDVVLELVIAPDGSVHAAHARGLGGVAPCVAGVASEIAFPAASSETRVRAPMTFRPS